MHEGRIIFAQIMDHLPRRQLNRCIRKYGGDRISRQFTCRDQFLAMAFAQLTLRDGLRGIQETLEVNDHFLYHMGFQCDSVPRSTLADANENRSWRIWAEFALVLMLKAQRLYAGEKLAIDLDAGLFVLDSTAIDLCLTSFPWAHYKQTKSAVKMHTLLNLRGQIPSFVVISDGLMSDVKMMDAIDWIAGAYYVMDRGYLDYKRLYHLHRCQAFFVTRARSDLRWSVAKSQPVDKTTGLRCDQTIRFGFGKSKVAYPEQLRRVKYYDQEKDKRLVFLTNDFDLPALTISAIYKQRWQVELFFKWIKQNLRIKQFYGYNENAVRTQLWIAVATYCLLAIIRKELGGDRELGEIQEILSASIFQKIPTNRAFSHIDTKSDPPIDQNQLYLPGF
jgi:IS4 transposase